MDSENIHINLIKKLIEMTPREKAEELYSGFWINRHLEESNEIAKKFSLIAVEEILNSCKTYLSPYYLEVKKEINKI